MATAAAFLAAAPAAGQGHARPHASQHRDPLVSTMRARIVSINVRIDMLRDRGAISGEEARELRQQSRRLELRLYGMSRRDAGDVELGLDRLETQVRFAADDARWGGRAFSGHIEDRLDAGDRYERFDRYQSDRHGDYRNFDRYTGSSVDRWHDPFDRGNNF